MSVKKVFTTALLILVLTAMIYSPVAAATTSVTKNGITLVSPFFPLTGPGLQSCEPWELPDANSITLMGVPEGSNVLVQFVYSSPYGGSPIYLPPVNYYGVVGGSLVVPVVYPLDSTNWPVFNAATNERAIAISAMVQVTAPTGSITKLIARQWWVRCQPPLDFDGCTPGYWRQEQHFDSWVGLSPTDDFNLVFGVSASFDPHTLLDAVWLGGGGENALARHAVAALLNVGYPGVDYQFSAAEIIAGVQNAYATGDFEPFKTLLDFANNAGCPLN